MGNVLLLYDHMPKVRASSLGKVIAKRPTPLSVSSDTQGRKDNPYQRRLLRGPRMEGLRRPRIGPLGNGGMVVGEHE